MDAKDFVSKKGGNEARRYHIFNNTEVNFLLRSEPE